VDLDPARFSELEERLNLMQTLKRKYGASLEAVVEFGANARLQLHQLENRAADLEKLQTEQRRLDTELRRVGAELSAARRRVLPKLNRAVIRQLADLGFRQAHFDIALESTSPETADAPSASTPGLGAQITGFDRIEFLFAPNPGEPPRPLRAIASSGEIARVMLALKTVLAAQDDIPLLVFDEIDANVAGETAHAVGAKMEQLGRQRQVLCITHLAPVAAAAPHHLVVRKDVREGRTLTSIDPLDPPGRVTELARMLGGQSEAARHHAETLLRHSPPK
jgi:DNA repair protein RecN (Recombination protein N)